MNKNYCLFVTLFIMTASHDCVVRPERNSILYYNTANNDTNFR